MLSKKDDSAQLNVVESDANAVMYLYLKHGPGKPTPCYL
jgi:hypothetical protein